ncbi:MAG: hypothetical protein HBSAPP03_26090 [Phycisphaerae bacterium]|nr:MAG: hypothetical protein HBSAPP03_26090 [Phycisphaerae bacterium]
MRVLILTCLLTLAGCSANQPATNRPDTRPAQPAQRAFRPSEHGFRFVNHFAGSPLPASLRDPGNPIGALLAGPVGRNIPATFGLCGGMSLTAADHYLAGVPMPMDAMAPTPGTPLYEHLYRRQVESLGDGGVMVAAFWTWMNLPDESVEGESTATLTALALPGILGRLDRGEVVPLGLVHVRARANARAPGSRIGPLWSNHQVVAFGYERLMDGAIDLCIYDPNYPGDDRVVVRLRPTAGGAGLIGERVTGTGRTTRVRGVFPMPYTPGSPFTQPR